MVRLLPHRAYSLISNVFLNILADFPPLKAYSLIDNVSVGFLADSPLYNHKAHSLPSQGI